MKKKDIVLSIEHEAAEMAVEKNWCFEYALGRIRKTAKRENDKEKVMAVDFIRARNRQERKRNRLSKDGIIPASIFVGLLALGSVLFSIFMYANHCAP